MLLNSVHKIRHLFESTDSIYHQLTIFKVVPFQLVLEIVIRISVVDSVTTLCVISVKWTPYTVTAFTKCEYREGPSIYDVHKKSGFWLPSLPLVDVHMRSTWKPIDVWKWLVQWPSRRIAEIRLYDCNLFKTVLLVIYITNLYHQKNPRFSVQSRYSGKKDANLFAWEEDRMMSVDPSVNVLCGRPHWAWPLPSIHTHQPEPDPPPSGLHKWMAPYIIYGAIHCGACAALW